MSKILTVENTIILLNFSDQKEIIELEFHMVEHDWIFVDDWTFEFVEQKVKESRFCKIIFN